MTATYLDRLAARSAAVGYGPVPRARSGPGRRCRRASAATRRRRGVRDARRRGRRAVRRRGQAEPRVLRGVRLGRAGGARADPGRDPGRTSRSSSTPSAATSARPRPGRPSRCSIGSAPTRSRSARTSGGEAPRPAARARRSLRLRPVPDVEPGRRRAPEPRCVAADPATGAPAEPLHLRVARRVVELGPGRDGRARRRRDRAGRAARDPRRRARAGVPRPGRRRPGRRDRAGPRGRTGDARHRPAAGAGRRPARQRLARDRRGRAAAPATGTPGTSERRSRRPPATGLRASLCYPSRRGGSRSAVHGRTPTDSRFAGAIHDHACLPPDPSSWSSSW